MFHGKRDNALLSHSQYRGRVDPRCLIHIVCPHQQFRKSFLSMNYFLCHDNYFSLLPVFNKLLERVELNVRLAVGLGVALLFELARECSSEDIDVLDSPESSDSYSLIEQLATESNRHTARKDRNQIRSCFRDILSSLDVSPVSHFTSPTSPSLPPYLPIIICPGWFCAREEYQVRSGGSVARQLG